jgi:hypothetical protein
LKEESIMAGKSAGTDIQVNLGKDLSTAIIRGVKVEVSPDSNVVAYTNEGVQTIPAAASDPLTAGVKVSVSEDFKRVVLNGARIEFAADGHLVISTPGIVITKPAAANDSAANNAAPQIGDKMRAGHPNAGWIYAGISKTTHEPFYVAPKDSGVFQWKEAMAFAAKEGSRVPSREELDQIYDAREKGALKDTFNVTGSDPAGWYWSSSQYDVNDAWAQRFSDGHQDTNIKLYDSSLRCVR